MCVDLKMVIAHVPTQGCFTQCGPPIELYLWRERDLILNQPNLL